MTDKQDAGGPAYDTAKFYDCRDSEQLSATEIEEAVYDLLSYNVDPERPAEEQIAKLGPVKVSAYNPSEVTEGWIGMMADRLAEDLAENYAEEYGDPDGISVNGEMDLERASAQLCPVVRSLVEAAGVWRCDVVGERTYSTDEVVQMMREYAPEWFEDIAARKAGVKR